MKDALFHAFIGFVCGGYCIEWLIFSMIQDNGRYAFGRRRIVGRVETKEFPK